MKNTVSIQINNESQRPAATLNEILLLPIENKVLCLPVKSIIRVEASSNYSKVFCTGQSFPIVAAKVLRWFEERLSQQMFVRVHRTHLVNKMYMVSAKDNTIILESGIKISISRRKRRIALSALNNRPD